MLFNYYLVFIYYVVFYFIIFIFIFAFILFYFCHFKPVYFSPHTTFTSPLGPTTLVCYEAQQAQVPGQRGPLPTQHIPLLIFCYPTSLASMPAPYRLAHPRAMCSPPQPHRRTMSPPPTSPTCMHTRPLSRSMEPCLLSTSTPIPW